MIRGSGNVIHIPMRIISLKFAEERDVKVER